MLGEVVVLVSSFIIVPCLVAWYSRQDDRLKPLQFWTTCLGLIWVMYALYHIELSLAFLGKTQPDSAFHSVFGGYLAKKVAAGDYDELWSWFSVGNRAYQVYLGFLYFVFGTSIKTAAVVNAVFAFWGGLALISSLNRVVVPYRIPSWLVLFTVFNPSVIFWSSTNLKAGFMFWALCFIQSVLVTLSIRMSVLGLAQIAVGFAVGGLLRPHIAGVWAFSLGLGVILTRQLRPLAPVCLLALPILVFAWNERTGTSTALDESIEVLNHNYRAVLSASDEAGIAYEGDSPVFVVSGVIAMFFRPFPWQVDGLAQLLAAIEVWFITGLLITAWIRLDSSVRLRLLGVPFVWVTLVVLLSLCVGFGWVGNEGHLVRYRIQALPALLTLLCLAWPFFRPSRINSTTREKDGRGTGAQDVEGRLLGQSVNDGVRM